MYKGKSTIVHNSHRVSSLVHLWPGISIFIQQFMAMRIINVYWFAFRALKTLFVYCSKFNVVFTTPINTKLSSHLSNDKSKVNLIQSFTIATCVFSTLFILNCTLWNVQHKEGWTLYNVHLQCRVYIIH